MVSVRSMVFWINKWAAVLSCRAISSVLLGVIAGEVCSALSVLPLFCVGVGR